MLGISFSHVQPGRFSGAEPLRKILSIATTQARGLKSVLKTMARSQPYFGHDGRVSNILAFLPQASCLWTHTLTEAELRLP